MNATARPVVFGEVLFDCFEDGTRVLGGAPFNVAWHLQAFGAAPVLVSAIGADANGAQVRETMGRWGMTLEGVQIDPAHATGEVQVVVRDDEPSYDIVLGRAFDYIRAERLPAVAAAVHYHGTLALRADTSGVALDTLLERARAPVFVDVNLRSPWWDMATLDRCLGRATWLKLNDEELAMLAPGQGGDVAARAARLRAHHDIETIIVTQGAEGALLVNRHGECVRARPASVERMVDTVGAGDAFAAVSILGLLRGWPAATLLERAGGFAALIVGQRGAVADDLAPYVRLAEQWQL